MQILANSADGYARRLHKIHAARATAQRFNPDRSAARKQIEPHRAFDSVRHHVEKRLPETVRGRPGLHARWRCQTPAFIFSRNHAHGPGLRCLTSNLTYRISFGPGPKKQHAMRNWSVFTARFGGVELRIHVTFLFLLIFLLLTEGVR